MKTFIASLCLFTLLTPRESLSQEDSRGVRFYIHFEPQSQQTKVRVIWQNREIDCFAIDTVLRLDPIRKTPKCTLSLEATGYQSINLSFNSDSLRLTNKIELTVKEKVIELQEVKIHSERMMYNRGDTLIIRTDSIKTKPFSGVAELLSKVPGVMIDGNGQLSVMGKPIQKVTVEGKALFGGSPKATLEVIRSEMVQQLEVLDNAQAGANLNIKLKADKKKGVYGNVGANIGLNKRYNIPLQANAISDRRFINGFISANNTNEKILNDQQETWLVNHFIVDDTQGAYSVVDLATFNGSVKLNPNQVNNLPINDRDKGVFSSAGGGANYTKTSEKQEWFGYLMTDFSKQSLFNAINQQNILGTIRQSVASRQININQNNNLWSAVSATLKPNVKNTWRLGLRMNAQYLTESIQDTQRIDNQENSLILSRTTTSLNKQTTTHAFYANQYISWVHRYSKPAQLFSVYANNSLSSLFLNQTYGNEWIGLWGNVLSNKHQISRDNDTQNLNVQLLYTQPLARRWLGEIRSSFEFEKTPMSQTAFQFNTKTQAYDLQRLDLSLESLVIQNNQQTLSFNVLYKGSKSTLKTGVSYWNWQSKRSSTIFEKTKWLPQFYWQYLGGKGKVNVTYTTAFEAISPFRLFPVIDSSNVQQVSVGNLNLQPFYTSKLELRGSTSTQSGNLYSLSVRYEKNENPVLFATKLSKEGLSSFGFEQLSDIQKIRATLFWTQYSRSKPYNFTVFLSGGWQQHNTVFNGQLQKFENYNLFASVSFQWNISKNLHLKADGRTSVFQQKQQGGYRGDMSVSMSYQWLDNLYIDCQNTSFLSRNSSSQTINYQIINANIYKYLLPTQRLKLSVGVSNLLDVKNTFENRLTANSKTEELSNHIPRLLMIGITYYADKWKK